MNPLVILGPGGDFVDWIVGDAGVTRTVRGGSPGAPADEQEQQATANQRGHIQKRAQEPMSPRRKLTDGVTLSDLGRSTGLRLAAERLIECQGAAIQRTGALLAGLTTMTSGAATADGVHRGGIVRRLLSHLEESIHESHAEAVEDPQTHPRHARAGWLFPDHAGARRRARRQQGHRVRACRGPHQEGRAGTRGKQGALFIH